MALDSLLHSLNDDVQAQESIEDIPMLKRQIPELKVELDELSGKVMQGGGMTGVAANLVCPLTARDTEKIV
jgi:hypothetical protein